RLRERARGAHGPRRAAARAVLLGDDLVADRLVRAARGLPHLPAGPHARDGAAAGAVRRRDGEDDRGLLRARLGYGACLRGRTPRGAPGGVRAGCRRAGGADARRRADDPKVVRGRMPREASHDANGAVTARSRTRLTLVPKDEEVLEPMPAAH